MISLYYFSNGKTSRTLGTNYDQYVVLDTVRVRRPLNSHEEMSLDLTLDRADSDKIPSGENLDGFHVLQYDDGSTPALSDILYSFYISNVRTTHNRDGSMTVSINCVSGTFLLSYVTSQFGQVTNKYVLHLIRDKLPSTAGTTNYSQQLFKFRTEFNQSKGVYISSGNFFCQSGLDILQDFVDSGAAKLWRTNWDTASGQQGRNTLDIVFADENTDDHTSLVKIIGSDLGTLETGFETPDELNTIYLVAPPRAGTSATVTQDIFQHQVLYNVAGTQFFSTPVVKTKPEPLVLGTPVYKSTDNKSISQNNVIGIVSTGNSDHLLMFLSGTRSLYYSTNGGTTWTEKANQLNGTIDIDSNICFDEERNTLFNVYFSTDSNSATTRFLYAASYSYDPTTNSLTFIKLSNKKSNFGRLNNDLLGATFADNSIWAVWSKNTGSIARYYIDPDTKDIVSLQAITAPDYSDTNALTSTNKYRLIFIHTDDGVEALNFGGTAEDGYNFSPTTANANTKAAYVYDDKIYLYDSTDKISYAYSLLVANPNTTTHTLNVGIAGTNDIEDYDALWNSGDRSTIQLNSKFIAPDFTRFVEITGNKYEDRPVKVKINNETEVATTVNTKETVQDDIVAEGKRRLREARSSKESARIQYNTRYQPSDTSFFAPLPGDRMNIVTGTRQSTVSVYRGTASGDSASPTDPINMNEFGNQYGLVREAFGGGYIYRFVGNFTTATFQASATFNLGVAMICRWSLGKPTNIQTDGEELANEGTTNNIANLSFTVSNTRGRYIWFYPSAPRTATDRNIQLDGTLESDISTEYLITEINESIIQDEIIRDLILQESAFFHLSREIKTYEKIIEDNISGVSGFVDTGISPL